MVVMWTGRLGSAMLVLAGGLVLGTLAFLWTGQTPRAYLGGPTCTATEDAAFDPWSGMGRGRVLTCIEEHRPVAMGE